MNLNGALSTTEGGAGFPGRPDPVALARLGDDSGIAILAELIRDGDPLGAVGG